MSSNKEIFNGFIKDVLPKLKAVSGRFANSIEAESDETGFTIYASPFIRVLIDGRKPTSPNAPKGDPTLQEIILKWIEEKGIVARANDKGVTPDSTQLSWAISQSIHKKGTLLYQRGGGNNIFDPILSSDKIDKMLSLLGQLYYVQLTSIVK